MPSVPNAQISSFLWWQGSSPVCSLLGHGTLLYPLGATSRQWSAPQVLIFPLLQLWRSLKGCTQSQHLPGSKQGMTWPDEEIMDNGHYMYLQQMSAKTQRSINGQLAGRYLLLICHHRSGRASTHPRLLQCQILVTVSLKDSGWRWLWTCVLSLKGLGILDPWEPCC